MCWLIPKRKTMANGALQCTEFTCLEFLKPKARKMSLAALPRNIETISFCFHSDRKWHNIAPVERFNLNKQASLPCQITDSKWQFLFGFNQKRQHFQCDISDSEVFELCVCLGWRWGWSLGHLSFLVYFTDLFVEGSGRKGPWEKDEQSLLPLPISLGFVGIMAGICRDPGING